ncbi:hypothetical protein [Microbulbifer agarilyticus]
MTPSVELVAWIPEAALATIGRQPSKATPTSLLPVERTKRYREVLNVFLKILLEVFSARTELHAAGRRARARVVFIFLSLAVKNYCFELAGVRKKKRHPGKPGMPQSTKKPS